VSNHHVAAGAAQRAQRHHEIEVQRDLEAKPTWGSPRERSTTMESTTTSLQAVPIAPSAIMATAAAGLCTNIAMATQLAAPAGGGHGEQAAAFLYMIYVLL